MVASKTKWVEKIPLSSANGGGGGTLCAKTCEALSLETTKQSQGWVRSTGKKSKPHTVYGGKVRATFASGKPLVRSPSPHRGFVQFLSSIYGNLPVCPLSFPHRKGSCSATGRRSSPRCRIQPMTQPQAEAVSWIYFGYRSSLLLYCQLYSCNWEGSTWSLRKVVFPV